MNDEGWKKFRACLARSRPEFRALNPDSPHGRLEGEAGGESLVIAYKAIWFFLEVQEPINRSILNRLLQVLKSIETEENHFFRPRFHLCFWQADLPGFFRTENLTFAYNTSVGTWADLMEADADKARQECLKTQKIITNSAELMKRTLNLIRQDDLAIFIAAQTKEELKLKIKPFLQETRVRNQALVAVMAEQIELSFAKISGGHIFEEGFVE